jgi:hypothetical protein
LLGQRLLAKLLAIHANYLFAQGRDQEMAAQAREAVALGTANGGFEGETFGTFVLGRVLQDLEEKREAGAMWQRTIQLIRLYQAEHPESELLHEAHWMAHNWLRGTALHFGDHTGSRTFMVQALQICQALGKRWGELYCLTRLAGIDFFLYDFAAAEAGFAAALDLARTLNYRWADRARDRRRLVARHPWRRRPGGGAQSLRAVQGAGEGLCARQPVAADPGAGGGARAGAIGSRGPPGSAARDRRGHPRAASARRATPPAMRSTCCYTSARICAASTSRGSVSGRPICAGWHPPR